MAVRGGEGSYERKDGDMEHNVSKALMPSQTEWWGGRDVQSSGNGLLPDVKVQKPSSNSILVHTLTVWCLPWHRSFLIYSDSLVLILFFFYRFYKIHNVFMIKKKYNRIITVIAHDHQYSIQKKKQSVIKFKLGLTMN